VNKTAELRHGLDRIWYNEGVEFISTICCA
jgi:hypothetical protein